MGKDIVNIAGHIGTVVTGPEKACQIEIIPRTKYDVIEITLPNGGTVRIQTSETNKIQITHHQAENENMVIKPQMGNDFTLFFPDLYKP